jgi:hypothetical protein
MEKWMYFCQAGDRVTSAFSSSETNNGTTTWYATLRYIENPEYSTVKQVVM